MEKTNYRCVVIYDDGSVYRVTDNDALIFNRYLGLKLNDTDKCEITIPRDKLETILNDFNKFSIDYDVRFPDWKFIKAKRFPVNRYVIIDRNCTIEPNWDIKNEINTAPVNSTPKKVNPYIGNVKIVPVERSKIYAPQKQHKTASPKKSAKTSQNKPAKPRRRSSTPTISEKEKANWPKYCDATRIRMGKRRR